MHPLFLSNIVLRRIVANLFRLVDVIRGYAETADKAFNVRRTLSVWHNIVVFGKLADVIEKYVHKGSRMYVEGKMRTRAFTDKNGVQKTITEINVDNLEMLDSKPTQQSANADVSQTNIRQTSQSHEQSVMFASEMRSDNDNLPF